MLNDSQQIGHSRPSSLLMLEVFSSSEQSEHDGLLGLFFNPPMLAMTFEVNFHIAYEGRWSRLLLQMCHDFTQNDAEKSPGLRASRYHQIQNLNIVAKSKRSSFSKISYQNGLGPSRVQIIRFILF